MGTNNKIKRIPKNKGCDHDNDWCHYADMIVEHHYDDLEKLAEQEGEEITDPENIDTCPCSSYCTQCGAEKGERCIKENGRIMINDFHECRTAFFTDYFEIEQAPSFYRSCDI